MREAQDRFARKKVNHRFHGSIRQAQDKFRGFARIKTTTKTRREKERRRGFTQD